MAITEESLQDIYSRSEGVTGAFFAFLCIIVARQGSELWFNMSKHPNWIPDAATLMVFLVTATAVIFTLAPMMVSMLTRTTAKLSESAENADPFATLGLVSTAVISGWAAAAVLYYRYFMRVSGRLHLHTGTGVYQVLWVPASIIFLYAVVGGTLVWTQPFVVST